MLQIIKYLLDRLSGKVLLKRSPKWRKVRNEYLQKHPFCECCEGKKGLEVHHKKPVHLFPELELEESNLMTLCARMKCHFIFGHCCLNWKCYNPNIEKDKNIIKGIRKNAKFEK